jgi:tRNA (guanine37-N1)-methyltransferase
MTHSMMKRAQEKELFTFKAHDIRAWTTDKHRLTDDAPFGGGEGMVMKPEPIFAAIEELRRPETKILLMTPSGTSFSQPKAAALSAEQHLIIICGHYEGIDQRVIDHLVDEEISIGDYVLTNGALAALVVVDAVTRLIPGVLGNDQSAAQDSFSHGLLEFPQYTRPAEFRGWKIPEILLSGHHGAIAAWRKEQSLEKTRRVRPDLIENSGDGSSGEGAKR